MWAATWASLVLIACWLPFTPAVAVRWLPAVSATVRRTRIAYLRRVVGGVTTITWAQVFAPKDVDLWTAPELWIWGVASAIAAAQLVGAWFTRRNPRFTDAYPEARHRRWSPVLWCANALCWTLHLVGYEWLLRGVQLDGLASELPVAAALGIHCVFYAFIHLGKGSHEVVGSLVMGWVYGGLFLAGGSLAPVVAAHVIAAVGAETLAMRTDDAKE